MKGKFLSSNFLKNPYVWILCAIFLSKTLIAQTSESEIDVELGWETGSIDSGLSTPLEVNFSFNGISSVRDGNGGLYEASELHYLAVEKVSWAREGSHVLKVYADGRNYGTGSDHSWRAELGAVQDEYVFYQEDEHYYSMSFWLDDTWDQTSRYSTIISQWKMTGGIPHAALRLSNLGDYKLTFAGIDWVGETDEGRFIGYAAPQAWNDIKVYFKKSLGSDGVVKVWLNGNLVFEHYGKNIPADRADNRGYVKFGMYTEIRDERIIYFDGVKFSSTIDATIEEWVTDQAHLPSVELTSPNREDQLESGSTLTITAIARDPGGKKLATPGSIHEVEFFAGTKSLGIDSTAPYSVSWMKPSDGPYTIIAVARDSDGNLASSEGVPIYIGPRRPNIDISTPSQLENFIVNEMIDINADASDSDGSITNVEFFVDDQSIGSDVSAPYSVSWNPPSAKAYVLTATATDTDGKTSTTSPVYITAGALIESSSVESVEDASLREGLPDSPGNWSKVEIYGKPNGRIIGIFKFDLSDFLNAPEIREAKLKLYTASVKDGGTTVTVFRSGGNNWSEDTVTWVNGPTRGNKITKLDVDQVGQYYVFDVSEYVAEKVAQSSQYITLWMEDNELTQAAVKFQSHTQSNPPQLEITTSSIVTGYVSEEQEDISTIKTLILFGNERNVYLKFFVTPGKSYRLEGVSQLSSQAGQWNDLGEITADSNGMATYQTVLPTEQYFYRLKTP
ncbi:MAG: Ig-like domain-containing protein [Lentimonas sp.]